MSGRGDYLCVHAGVRPGVPLAEQKPADLRWIRDSFLRSTRDHEFIVVHGHTVSDAGEECVHGIGIDPGAFASGMLSAVGLEGEERWFLRTQGAPDERYRMNSSD